MKQLHYKKQKFQHDAVLAVSDVFEGLIGETVNYDLGIEKKTKEKKLSKFDINLKSNERIIAWKNDDFVNFSDEILKKNIQNVQVRNGFRGDEITVEISKEDINLTIEMETGTGKTYTYINTIFELNKKYNWTKFIIVVPSIAIREGVYKSFEDMEEHFLNEYGKKINCFVFNYQKDPNSNNITNFAKSDDINVMIINSQAFNSDARKIHDGNNENGITPIVELQRTKPILIIDEPQTVEGKNKQNQTRKYIQEFKPLFTLRYSATHRESYNMIYKLDAVDAFNQKLVKRIEINGIQIKGSTATHGYLFIENILVSSKDPRVRIEIQKSNFKRETHIMNEGDNIYEKYSQLTQYKGWVIDRIDTLTNSIHIRTPEGDKIFSAGTIYGEPDTNYKRRIQIRETIKSHFKKESINYQNGIKTISLFFIDRVDKYRQYDDEGNALDGEYAEIFIEEYNQLLPFYIEEYPYLKEYLDKISTNESHQGYFSIDKKSKQLKNPSLSGRGSESSCNDVGAFDLIMKDKKRLLDLKNHVRFIFSHSALKEGWDNPNVFQICILRDNDVSNLKLRQEIGRGLRLCVNQNGDRIDSTVEDIDSNKLNILTLIANDSYEDTAKKLQQEFSENLKNRYIKFTVDFLKTQKLDNKPITSELAGKIHNDFVAKGYLTIDDEFTDKYNEDAEKGTVQLHESLQPNLNEINALAEIISSNKIPLTDGNKATVTTKLKKKLFEHPEFEKLWNYINSKSYYTVDFDTKELINNSIDRINKGLFVSSVYVESVRKILKDKIENNEIEFEDQEDGITTDRIKSYISKTIKFDLITSIVDKTRLTKQTIIDILTKINGDKFDCFKENPEEFIKKIGELINEEKAKLLIKDIKYHKTDEKISKDIFEEELKIDPNKSISTPYKYIYDKLEFDSIDPEKYIGEWADSFDKLIVFAKIPRKRFNISTPLNENFSPDWLMVFEEGKVLHAYCVFESKASHMDLEKRGIENIKIECARRHFEAISDNKIKFDVVTSKEDVLNQIKIQ